MSETLDDPLGLINMASNIDRDILTRTQILKKGVKDLYSILGNLYEKAKTSNNNKLIFIKRDVDKLNAASNYLNNLDLPDLKKENKESSFNEDMLSLYNETLKNISKMQEMFKKQEASERKDLAYSGKFFKDQKNLDNLKLAHNSLRQMQVGTHLSAKDWNEIEKK